MNDKKIRRYLDIIRKSCDLIEQEMDGILDEPMVIEKMKAPQIEEPVFDRKGYVNNLLAINEWPEAVPPYLITSETSIQDQIDRANSVLDMILDGDVSGAEFLDFGCGDGWIAKQAIQRKVASSTGYDINKSDAWKKINGPKFTNDFQDLKPNHYSIIMLYDVLDHAENPEQVMQQVGALLAKGGKVYVRCHPWSSKHASHLFKQGLNKAYIHLFLSWEEIFEVLGKSPMYSRIEKNPIEAYHWWFHDFKVISERFIREPVNSFFLTDEYKKLIQREQKLGNAEIDQFMDYMAIQFVDYRLMQK